MNCLQCNSYTLSLDKINVCLDQSCQQNILCQECCTKHPSFHQKPIFLKKFLNKLQNKLPDENVLQSINSSKVLQELENNFQRSNKLFRQLKESVIRQIDIVVNQTTQLFEHLHKQYQQMHAKIVKLNSQRNLIEDVKKQQDIGSLKRLIGEFIIQQPDQTTKNSDYQLENSKTVMSISSSMLRNSQLITPKSAKQKNNFDQINQANANIYRKFENIHKEVIAFNEFSQQVLEKELDKSSQLLYESFENIKKFITFCSQSAHKTKLVTNKFLDTLQPLFQKEDQIICHKNNMPVQAIVVNAKQNQIITASYDCNIIVRDIHNLAELQTLKAHTQWIRSLALQEYSINNPFHYSKSILISCGDDKLVQSWILNQSASPCLQLSQNEQLSQSKANQTQDVLKQITFQLNIKACLLCMISTNQVAICTGPTDNFKTLIYDITNSQCLKILTGNRKYIRSVIHLEDKNYLCTGSDDGVIGIWNLNDVKNEKFKFRLNASLFPIQSLIYEEKNNLICAGCQDGKILIYSIQQVPKLLKIIQSSTCTSVSTLCKLNSNYFVAAVGKNILVYLFQNGTLINSINNKNSNNISVITYCPLNQKLLVGDVRGQLSSYAVLIV
ncbi:WD domain, G-beta repeat protein (macronuclear) [Tetrahymena thermophila SB210]|uniref:WD domain, G-beta repeat protein n=1 Tax=Tetrahymena thermophila (strain SB210) TaxID=312017 RepID=I7LXZ9_TETTS|nr:WD domain, G-beta repeat protein [Tetrahymena thermophila SB210]EAS07074.2 WD domain, G-beta repeat protein [Tetrahymena thermophila SB210]|eukprot:XP_001027316.2 WD domain, G-beta repeat protein [Tetrahymena thermophila SB210]